VSFREGLKSLPKQIWQLGWISFFNDVCSEMAYPILALFMVAIGQGPAALGFVEGIAEAIVSFMKGASGVRSDVTGRRVPYIQWGYFMTSVSKAFVGLANGWGLVLAGRSLDRFGKGVRTTARDTLIVDSMEQKRLGAAFGLHRAMDTAGAFVGVLLTLLLLYIFRGSDQLKVYRTIFFVSVVPGFFAVVLTLKLREAKATEEAPGEVKEKPKISLKGLPSGYWKAIIITCVFALANSSDTFLVLRANDVFKNSAGVAGAAILAIWAYALYNAVYTLVSYPAGEWSDTVGRWIVLGIGWLIYAAVYAGFALVNGWLIWVLFAIYGIYIGMTDGVSKALVGDFAPKHAKGTAMGVYYMFNGFATLAASGLMGILWTVYGYKTAFLFEAGAALVSVVLVVLLGRKKKEG
jgi:MFS family permease